MRIRMHKPGQKAPDLVSGDVVLHGLAAHPVLLDLLEQLEPPFLALLRRRHHVQVLGPAQNPHSPD